MKIAVSACLMGENCKYNGGNNLNARVIDFIGDKEYIKICPEVLAGLGTPRVPIEIVNGEVISRDGVNVDKEIREAVEKILATKIITVRTKNTNIIAISETINASSKLNSTPFIG